MTHNKNDWPNNGYRADFPRSTESTVAQHHRLALLERAAAELTGVSARVDTTQPQTEDQVEQFPFRPDDN